MSVHPGTDGAVADLLVRSGRFFTRSDVSADLRTVTKSGGREGDFYRDRWSHDKVVRSTHGVNCTAVALAKLFGLAEVARALGHAAIHARFAEADQPSILNHHASSGAAGQAHRAGGPLANPGHRGLGRPRSAPAPARH